MRFGMRFFRSISNDDERKVALARISHEMDDLDACKSSTRAIRGKRRFLACDIRLVFTFSLTDSLPRPVSKITACKNCT